MVNIYNQLKSKNSMNADLVFKSEKGNPVTTSLLVAETFEKDHRNVMRDIDNLIKDVLNFEQMFYISSYSDSYNRKQRMYIMNRDGFTLLSMGFTGKKAMSFKLEYIQQFNRMEQSLKQIDFSNPDTVLMLAQNWKEEQSKRIEAEKRAAIMQPKADFVDRAVDMGNLTDIGQAAKILKLSFGRNTLFRELQEKGIFFKGRNEPKQEYIQRGYFELRQREILRDNHPAFMVTKVLVTQKGLFWLSKMFNSTAKTSVPALNPQ